MKVFPTIANIQLNTEEGHHIFRDHQSTQEGNGYGEKEEQVHSVVQARLVEKVLEERGSYIYQPPPMKEQMGHNGGTKCQRKPFMDGVAGQVGASNDKNSSEDRQVKRQIGFGRYVHGSYNFLSDPAKFILQVPIVLIYPNNRIVEAESVY